MKVVHNELWVVTLESEQEREWLFDACHDKWGKLLERLDPDSPYPAFLNEIGRGLSHQSEEFRQ